MWATFCCAKWVPMQNAELFGLMTLLSSQLKGVAGKKIGRNCWLKGCSEAQREKEPVAEIFSLCRIGRRSITARIEPGLSPISRLKLVQICPQLLQPTGSSYLQSQVTRPCWPKSNPQTLSSASLGNSVHFHEQVTRFSLGWLFALTFFLINSFG